MTPGEDLGHHWAVGLSGAGHREPVHLLAHRSILGLGEYHGRVVFGVGHEVAGQVTLGRGGASRRHQTVGQSRDIFGDDARGGVRCPQVRHEVRREISQTGIDRRHPSPVRLVQVGAGVLEATQLVGPEPLLDRTGRHHRADGLVQVEPLTNSRPEPRGLLVGGAGGIVPCSAEDAGHVIGDRDDEVEYGARLTEGPQRIRVTRSSSSDASASARASAGSTSSGAYA